MFKGSLDDVVRTLRAGDEIVHRMLSFPKPVIAACPGHAVAQGAFMLLAADVRIGSSGDRKVGLNEVMIGMTIPHYGVEVARQRLSPAWFNHSLCTGMIYTPDVALTAGFFDQLVAPEDLAAATQAEAKRLSMVNLPAHAATKLRVRAPALAAIRAGVDSEFPAK